ncbi:MAG: signal peptidase II [Ignavibacteriae bacterium]|nr:signal peptidase II [Ignavibacteriota bacterium]
MRVLALSGIIVFCDQIAKLLVKGITIPGLGISIQGMQYGASKPIIGDFLRLTYIENPGMAFGIDIGGKLFFSIFSIIASVAILVYLYRVRRDSLGFRVSLAMILGGALGNLIDRVFYGVFFDEAPMFYGKVVDFVDVDFFNISILGFSLSRWPVFNIADASVTIGVVLLLFLHRSSETSTDEALPLKIVPADGGGSFISRSDAKEPPRPNDPD